MIHGLPPGVDFPAELVAGLRARWPDPVELARVRVYLNSARMLTRVREAFLDGPPGLLPHLGLVTDISAELIGSDLPDAVPAVKRRLDLARLISELLDLQPDMAPRSALYDLSDSLARLISEMSGEGVSPDSLRALDVTDASGHWQRSLKFVDIARHFADAPDAEGCQRLAVEALVARWAKAPPTTPFVIAGSTGSRGTTFRLMQAVAGLQQGHIVLPGFDVTMGADIWRALGGPNPAEDHPQYRFFHLLDSLSQTPAAVLPWTDAPAPAPDRNALISLSLRPAPVTDGWLRDGPKLGPLGPATEDITLIEAASERDEALALALLLRDAAEHEKKTALITPDRTLVRRLSAILDTWGIRPDDSGGEPLPQTAPGRLVRQASGLMGRRPASEDIIALLKHPLAHAGSGRGDHLRHTRDLELFLRTEGNPYPHQSDLIRWHTKAPSDGREIWVDWLWGILSALEAAAHGPLANMAQAHLTLAQHLSQGADPEVDLPLWRDDAGAAVLAALDDLRLYAGDEMQVSATEYHALAAGVLSGKEVTESLARHPGVLIWGTLEARVQGADLVILAGLNDGIWPPQPDPDPWLSRQMRRDAGLLMPDRQIGLSAHDFQQAIGAPEVVISRALRSSDAETVTSRWVNRLTNLLGGLGNQGESALGAMRSRGQRWQEMARVYATRYRQADPADRPAPVPPQDALPSRLSATEIKTLKRDPYAVYARRVLRLDPLPPLRPEPDAADRGTVLHRIMELFVAATRDDPTDMRAEVLNRIAREVLDQEVPWQTERMFWTAHVSRIAGWVVETETTLRAQGRPAHLEASGRLLFDDPQLEIRGKADRLDLAGDGTVSVYDYKTGHVPSKKEQDHYDRQLALMALMAEDGGFQDKTGAAIAPAMVARMGYIGLGSTPKFDPIALQSGQLAKGWAEISKLLQAYFREGHGFASRAALFREGDVGTYDHLARFGEWPMSAAPVARQVGR
ncbi:MAG: double-strand break repair protein AddB [Pseudomonadota bacterium]